MNLDQSDGERPESETGCLELHTQSVCDFAPRPPNPSEPTLLWKMSQTRDMFREYRLWPSFVGAKNDIAYTYTPPGSSGPRGAAMGLLPVLIWPEQEQYLKENGFDLYISPTAINSTVDGVGKSEQESNAKKRKLDTDSVDTSIVQLDQSRVIKRPRTDDNDNKGVVNKISGFIWSVLTAPLLLFPKQQTMSNSDYQYAIFRECAKRGYFVGPGDVYGGDYNIYRGGDPSNSHSTATVRVVRRRSITGRDLLSFSRVQNQVAKSAVLAYVDPTTRQTNFLVANFRNVSDRM